MNDDPLIPTGNIMDQKQASEASLLTKNFKGQEFMTLFRMILGFYFDDIENCQYPVVEPGCKHERIGHSESGSSTFLPKNDCILSCSLDGSTTLRPRGAFVRTPSKKLLKKGSINVHNILIVATSRGMFTRVQNIEKVQGAFDMIFVFREGLGPLNNQALRNEPAAD